MYRLRGDAFDARTMARIVRAALEIIDAEHQKVTWSTNGPYRCRCDADWPCSRKAAIERKLWEAING